MIITNSNRSKLKRRSKLSYEEMKELDLKKGKSKGSKRNKRDFWDQV